MEQSIPDNIHSSTLFKALALNGTSLLVLDGEDRVTWASDSAHVLFGRTQNLSLIGNRWADLIVNDGESVWVPELDDEFRSNGYLKTEGYCDVGNRGRIAIELVMYPVDDADISKERLVLVRDISEEKAYEEQLEDEKRNAESLNRALEKEISKANELAVMAERANIAKSVFLTSMSHEFRTPLNGVLGYSQILNADETLSPSNKKAATTIERCGKHLLSIINDVLDLSKIEAGKVEVAKDPMNLKTLTTEVMDVFNVRATGKGLHLNCKYEVAPFDVEWIEGDPKLIRQILINLIGNAIKFTDQGSVQLKIEATGNSENLELTGIKISVIDTGPGIEKQYAEQVFEEFYQTEAFSGHKGGTGLGLAISKKLVAAMGGSLKVDSIIGEGSNFHFTLPTKIANVSATDAISCLSEFQMTLASQNVGFIRCFDANLDNGVLQRVLEDMGVSQSNCFTCSESELEVQIRNRTTSKLFLGISTSIIERLGCSKLQELVASTGVEIVILYYRDVSQRRSKEVVGDTLCNAGIEIPIPIDIQQLKKELVQAVPNWFLLENPVPDVEQPLKVDSTAELSHSIPGVEILKELLFNANIGDMRAVGSVLDDWVSTIQGKTEFETKAKGFIDTFKIDQLCVYLQGFIDR